MLLAAGFAAALCIVVTVIHLEDQDWFSFAKEPAYIQVGYVLLEVAGLIAAALLVTRPSTAVWLLAVGVGIAPFAGYILSRGPGLPDSMDEKGEWGEPLGVVSLVVEGLLTVIAVTAVAIRLVEMRRAAQPTNRRETTPFA
jgi:hypothetical protein